MMQPRQQQMPPGGGRGMPPAGGQPMPGAGQGRGAGRTVRRTPTGDGEVTPEQQEAAMQAMQAAHNVIYDKREGVMDAIISAVADPQVQHVPVLSQALVQILDKVEDVLGPQDIEVLAAVGQWLIQQISAGLEAAGQEPLTPEDLSAIMQKTMQLWLQQHGDEVDMEALRGMVAGGGGAPAGPSGGPVAGGGLLAQMTQGG